MCSDPHAYNPRLAIPDPENIATSYLVSPWDEAVSAHLRRFAHGLDSKAAQQSDNCRNQDKRMENAAQLILRLFQICASDSRTQIEDSKKLGMMGLANQLFKIYFQINKLNLCKSMIRAIDNLNINDRFSLAQRVTYCYYVGRKAMFDGDFISADKSLSFAFDHCLSTKWNNKRLILIYLIPIKMLLVSKLNILNALYLFNG
ncbi:unnamed protein product [Trichobilharzia regenti]|nr:unnamed protein product [Trichobilharzia regenti]